MLLSNSKNSLTLALAKQVAVALVSSKLNSLFNNIPENEIDYNTFRIALLKLFREPDFVF